MSIPDAFEDFSGPVVTEPDVTVACDVVRATEMCFDIGAGYSAWEPFAETKSLTLWDIEGPQTIHGRFRDAGGVVTELMLDVYLNLAAPSVPTSLTAEPIIGGVRLAWDPSTGTDLEGYAVYAADDPAAPFEHVGFVPAATGTFPPWELAAAGDEPFPPEEPMREQYAVRGLEPGQTYWFQVRAADSMFESEPGTISAQAGEGVERIAGDSRYSTAVEASKRHFDSAETVVLASGAGWADALSAGALAGAHDGPVLLTKPAEVPEVVSEEIERLGASQVIVVGGAAAVSDDVVDELAIDCSVRRIAGATRYATAAEIAKAAVSAAPGEFDGEVFIVSGRKYADALAAGPVSCSQLIPVLLATPDGLPAETAAAIDWMDADEVVVLGGTASVPEEYRADLPYPMPVERIEGLDRYSTASTFAVYAVMRGWTDGASIGVANGRSFADGLAGGAAIGSDGGVLLLSAREALPEPSRMYLMFEGSAITSIEMFGGEGVLTPDVESDLLMALMHGIDF